MTSSRPYLIRAIYDWLTDNDLTPHILVNAEHPQAVIPRQHVKDGQIVLNISLSAVQDLNLGNDGIQFGARFGGTPMEVSVPPDAVLGIYARENGQGMLFPEEESEDQAPEDEPEPPTPQRPTLKVVK
jgi:stringent starvation protein B